MTTPSDPAPQTPPQQPAPQPQAAPIVSWKPPQEEAGPAPGVKFASHGVRLVAYIIDGLIVGLVYLVVFVIMFAVLIGGAWASDFRDGQLSPAGAAAIGLASIIFLLTFLLTSAYFPFFWARSGQTPGMRPFGLYVVRDSDGGKISTGQAILRLSGMWVSAFALYIGFIWIFIDPRRRGWHDLIGGTVVIERTSRG